MRNSKQALGFGGRIKKAGLYLFRDGHNDPLDRGPCAYPPEEIDSARYAPCVRDGAGPQLIVKQPDLNPLVTGTTGDAKRYHQIPRSEQQSGVLTLAQPASFPRIGVTLRSADTTAEQNAAQSTISPRLFAKRSPRRYAASTLFSVAWASDISTTSRG